MGGWFGKNPWCSMLGLSVRQGSPVRCFSGLGHLACYVGWGGCVGGARHIGTAGRASVASGSVWQLGSMEWMGSVGEKETRFAHRGGRWSPFLIPPPSLQGSGDDHNDHPKKPWAARVRVGRAAPANVAQMIPTLCSPF